MRNFGTSRWRERALFSPVGIAAILFIIAILALLIFPFGRGVFTDLRQMTSDFFAPVLNVSAGLSGRVSALKKSSQLGETLAEENTRLRAEIDELRRETIELSRFRLIADRYQALLGISLPNRLRYVTARVTADVSSPFSRTIIIDTGAGAGVVSGQPVIGGKGFVGRVISVGDATARVILLTDFNSRVPVFIGKQRVRGILGGDNRPMPRLDFLPKDTRIEKGARVMSSGDAGLVPAGLPIGRVHDASEHNVIVQLNEDMGRLDYVRVILTAALPPPPQDIVLPPELR